ncbi:MAG: EF-P lysine aminoacylase GenX [Proteobacteria bacterium]|nr:EF-P lysine aminoacylase GenX [Pseudomonadota bacterium]MBU1688799.1 EF-P lysine aminoacylase GenX [Pseudomonadota bacterium]
MISGGMLRRRSEVLQEVRNYFVAHDFLEVDTPILLPSLAPEPWIEPIEAGDRFLQTSPELCMKRLIAAGEKRIYQICRCFRQGERGRRHLPEFLMIEWYRADADYRDLMKDCEGLLRAVAGTCSGGLLTRHGSRISLERPWPRITVAEAFSRYAGITPETALTEGCFEEVLVEQVESNLGFETPVFLIDYPGALASLSRLKKNAPGVAERFELYAGGLEIANGFSELIDPVEQRHRFEGALAEIRQDGRRPGPMPESFLKSLPTMPETAGIALGLDRLIMLVTGVDEIDGVVPFVPEEL